MTKCCSLVLQKRRQSFVTRPCRFSFASYFPTCENRQDRVDRTRHDTRILFDALDSKNRRLMMFFFLLFFHANSICWFAWKCQYGIYGDVLFIACTSKFYSFDFSRSVYNDWFLRIDVLRLYFYATTFCGIGICQLWKVYKQFE